MKTTMWTLQILLAIVFVGAGASKLLTPKGQLAQSMRWARDFSGPQITLIGAAEVAGAIGLIAPAGADVLPILTPMAGAALSALMAGAAVTHLRIGEAPYIPLFLALLAALVAGLRLRARPTGGRASR